MPKQYRLSRADFIRLPKARRRIHGKYFSVTPIPFPALGGPRAACVVSKKIAARSVDRNRIERSAREALRPLLAKTRASVALIVYAKREALEASPAEVVRDIEKLLRESALQDTMPTP